MGEFPHTYFGDLKDDVLKEIPRGVFGIFVDAYYLCAFCNMSEEYRVASTFDQRYPAFLVGHSTQYVAFRTLLPMLSTLD